MFRDKKMNQSFNENDHAGFMGRVLAGIPIRVQYSPLMDECREFAYEEVARHLERRKGKVYIANNLLHYNHLKIGRTRKSIPERERSLNSAGVVGEIKIMYHVDCIDATMAESLIHRRLAAYHQEKEFFDVPLDMAIHTMEQCVREVMAFYENVRGDISAGLL